MLDLAAVLTLDNRAFLLRCFRLVFEHREEPRRAARIGREGSLCRAGKIAVHFIGFLAVSVSVHAPVFSTPLCSSISLAACSSNNTFAGKRPAGAGERRLSLSALAVPSPYMPDSFGDTLFA